MTGVVFDTSAATNVVSVSDGQITVTSTAYSRAAAWVVALAFLAIAVFVVVGIVRRIRAARR